MRAPRSLKSHLLIGVGFITLIALVVADIAVYAALHAFLYGQLDTTLSRATTQVTGILDQSLGRPAPGGGSANTAAPPSIAPDPNLANLCSVVDRSAPGIFVQVRNSSGKVIRSCDAFTPGSPGYAPLINEPNLRQHLSRSATITAHSTIRGGPTFLVRMMQRPDGSELALAIPTVDTEGTLNELIDIEVAVTASALLAAVLLSLFVVRAGLRPLRDVERAAQQITGDANMDRIDVANPDTEVGHLAIALNTMLDSMASAFSVRDMTESQLRGSQARLRQFVADASHELRTPIAAVSAYAQLFGHGAAGRPDDLARVISGIERETERMARLVENLLLLAKLDESPASTVGSVELVRLVAEAVEMAQTLGPEWPLELLADQAIEVQSEPVALRQMVDNLLANVRTHTPAGTTARIRVGKTTDAAYVEVTDTGPGFSIEDSSHLFERFYRADASRTRSTGGAGLGLAIVASLARSFGGNVTARSVPGEGATFRITLRLFEAGPEQTC